MNTEKKIMKVKTDKCNHSYKEECINCEEWKTEIKKEWISGATTQ